MNRPLTKYLLLIPLSYIGYCYYGYYRENIAKEELANQAGNPQSLNFQYARFRKCKTTPELGNILKKTLKYVRTNITELYNANPQIDDCQVIDTGKDNDRWWSYHYHTLTTLRANKYTVFQCQKEGFYNLLFWTGLTSKQQLRLRHIENDEAIIEQIIAKREDKCYEIAKNSKPTSNIDYQKLFVECLRKTEGVSRILEKEFNRIELMKSYKLFV